MPLLSPAVCRYVLLVVDDHDSLPARLATEVAGAEVITCSSPEVAAGALGSGRRYSAVVAREVGPELAALASRTGIPVLTVARGAAPAQLATALAARATPVRHVDRPLAWSPESGADGPADRRGTHGRLVVVCGPGGTGASTIAAALAVAFASLPRVGSGRRRPGATRRPRVLLADLALRADQAFLSGVDDYETGLLDLLDAGRYRSVTAADARRHTIPRGQYRLLPGLRRPGHWTAVSPAAVDSVLEGVVGIFDQVVADITADFEGEAETGSLDVEDRNHLARRSVEVADAVVVVGGPGANGTRRLALVIDDLLDRGVDPARIQPVINAIPEPGATGALAHVCGLPAAPVPVTQMHDAVGGRLAPAAVIPVVTAIASLLARLPAPAPPRPALIPITPGTLGCHRP